MRCSSQQLSPRVSRRKLVSSEIESDRGLARDADRHDRGQNDNCGGAKVSANILIGRLCQTDREWPSDIIQQHIVFMYVTISHAIHC